MIQVGDTDMNGLFPHVHTTDNVPLKKKSPNEKNKCERVNYARIIMEHVGKPGANPYPFTSCNLEYTVVTAIVTMIKMDNVT